MRTLVGIIAEDDSDVAVIDAIIKKLARISFGIEKFLGGGSARIRSKCRIWSENLEARGCKLLIILHDADTSNPQELRDLLETKLRPSPIRFYVIVIPVHEIEAWLLADHQAIQRALKLRQTVGKVPNPAAIIRPKEHLRDLVFKKSGNRLRYLNSIHNKMIAKECSPLNLRRCASFLPFERFVRGHMA